MCGVANTVSRGLGAVFTGGLSEFGPEPFRKIGRTVGNVLTLQAPNAGTTIKGRVAPKLGGPLPTAPNSATESKRLEDLLTPVRTAANAQIDQQYADQMRRIRAGQAARGVLRSGVADYPTTELGKAAALARGNVEGALASKIADVEGNRSLFNTQSAYDAWKMQQEFNQKQALAAEIADANKKSTLDEIFSGVQTFMPLILTAVTGNPAVGAAAGAATGGKSGGLLGRIFGSKAAAPTAPTSADVAKIMAGYELNPDMRGSF